MPRESCFWIFLDLCPSIPHCVPFCTPTVYRERRSILEGKRERSVVSVVVYAHKSTRAQRASTKNTGIYTFIASEHPGIPRHRWSLPSDVSSAHRYIMDNVSRYSSIRACIRHSALNSRCIRVLSYPIKGATMRHASLDENRMTVEPETRRALNALRGTNAGLLRSSVKREVNNRTSNRARRALGTYLCDRGRLMKNDEKRSASLGL